MQLWLFSEKFIGLGALDMLVPLENGYLCCSEPEKCDHDGCPG